LGATKYFEESQYGPAVQKLVYAFAGGGIIKQSASSAPVEAEIRRADRVFALSNR